jgi:non-heme Fe2+,alpha-ketoglutarate-dependent halogenase
MPKRLNEDQILQYKEEGFCFPVPVLNSEEFSAFRADLERYELKLGQPLDFPEKSKPHMLFDWADKIAHHPAILDAVEDLIGPNILLYHITLWTKEAGAPSYVLWHQDGAYFFLEPAEQVTAWVALSDAPIESGCMHVIPRTHKGPWLPHFDDLGPNNMIKRGQGIKGLEDQTGIPMPLRAGEMSLHHTKLIHSSSGNNYHDRRIGVGLSYIPADVRPVNKPVPTALLVRGQAQHDDFIMEKRLKRPETDEARSLHSEAVRRFRARQDAGSKISNQSET